MGRADSKGSSKTNSEAVSPTLERAVADFLRSRKPLSKDNPRAAAYEVLKWAGEYAQLRHFPRSKAGGEQSVHQLPEVRFGDDAQNVPAPNHGELGRVAAGEALIKGLVEPGSGGQWLSPRARWPTRPLEHQIRVDAPRETDCSTYPCRPGARNIQGVAAITHRNKPGLSLEQLLLDSVQRQTVGDFVERPRSMARRGTTRSRSGHWLDLTGHAVRAAPFCQ